MKESYLDYHEDVRRMSFATEDDFLYAISYDAVTLYYLENHSLQNVEEGCFISSLHYFVETVPELFEKREYAYQAEAKLTEMSHQKGYRKRVVREAAKDALDYFQKIKK